MRIWPCSACQHRRRPGGGSGPPAGGGGAPDEGEGEGEEDRPLAEEKSTASSSTAPAAGSAEQHKQLGNEHFKRKEYAKAVSAYSRAIDLQPDEAAFWLNRSISQRNLGRWEEAEADASEALRLQPGNEKAAYGRALALQKLGKIAEALEACEAGVQRHGDSKVLLELKKSLQADQVAARRKAELAQRKADLAARKYDNDYSKWADLEDSEDERQGEEQFEKTWKGRMPTMEERLTAVEDMLQVCSKTSQEVNMYFGADKVSGTAKLPPDHQSPVGVISLEQLGKFSCSNDRMLVSVYGDIFDVSSRPDLYGYGPKSIQAGRDITWAVVTGKETPANFNRFYDIFKLDMDHRTRYLQIICQRLVAFEQTFGPPIGRLDKFVDEHKLPPAPKEEIEECKQQ